MERAGWLRRVGPWVGIGTSPAAMMMGGGVAQGLEGATLLAVLGAGTARAHAARPGPGPARPADRPAAHRAGRRGARRARQPAHGLDRDARDDARLVRAERGGRRLGARPADRRPRGARDRPVLGGDPGRGVVRHRRAVALGAAGRRRDGRPRRLRPRPGLRPHRRDAVRGRTRPPTRPACWPGSRSWSATGPRSPCARPTSPTTWAGSGRWSGARWPVCARP